jgi:hypothetical protein
MKTRLVITVFILLVAGVLTVALWRTPITAYTPRSEEERAIADLFIAYITARNQRDVDGFLATLHEDCRYRVTKDRVVTKAELSGMLPDLWMQNDDGNAAFGRCMAWECWNENFYETGMLINPQFRIVGNEADVKLKFHSGLFLDDNFFHLTKEDQTWRIINFARPIY